MSWSKITNRAGGKPAGSSGAIILHDGSNWVDSSPGARCFWEEDFEMVQGTAASGGAAGAYIFGSTGWSATALSISGSASFLAGEASHPGIVRLLTDASDNSKFCLHRGGPNADSLWIAGQDIGEFVAIVRSNLTQTKAFMIGFSDDVADLTTSGPTDIMAFMFDSDDTALDVNVQCVVKEASAGGTPTVTDSGVSLASIHGAFTKFRISQQTLGTVQFHINDNLVATMATRIADAELMNLGFTVQTRAASQTCLDVDYVYFRSRPLTRF